MLYGHCSSGGIFICILHIDRWLMGNCFRNNMPSGVLTMFHIEHIFGCRILFYLCLKFCALLENVLKLKVSIYLVGYGYLLSKGVYSFSDSKTTYQQHILNDKSNNLKQFKGNLIQNCTRSVSAFFFSH